MSFTGYAQARGFDPIQVPSETILKNILQHGLMHYKKIIVYKFHRLDQATAWQQLTERG